MRYGNYYKGIADFITNRSLDIKVVLRKDSLEFYNVTSQHKAKDKPVFTVPALVEGGLHKSMSFRLDGLPIHIDYNGPMAGFFHMCEPHDLPEIKVVTSMHVQEDGVNLINLDFSFKILYSGIVRLSARFYTATLSP